jgi:competence protein ComEA
MERYRRLVLILLAVAVSIPVVLKSRPNPHPGVPAAFSVATSARGYVRISGDVRHPGMYPWRANLLTNDVILMARPLKPVTVLEPAGIGVVPLDNGEALHVAFTGTGTARVTRGAVPAAERLVMGIPLDINSMSESDLDRVPGIGPALARRIVQYRQYNGGSMSVRELLLVEGVGEKKFSALGGYFQPHEIQGENNK